VRENKNSIQIRQFKAKIRASKPHFMQKVVFRRVTIKDAFNKRFRSFISVFIPKLTPHYQKPHIMLHIANGGGSCLLRCESPDKLVEILQDLINTINSEKWVDYWWRVEDYANNLLDNKLTLNEELVDINEWHKALEDTIDLELTEVK
jgi:hypothetical protein